MSYLKILSSALVELATIYDVTTSKRNEIINSDNTLSFSMLLNSANTALINATNVIGLDADYFDIAKYKKGQAEDGRLTCDVDCEHISYRLNNSEYNKDYFTENGTPTAILTAILTGTGFSVGTVEFTSSVTYSAQQAVSRRGLLVQFAELLGGELLFNGFSVSILAQRGSTTPRDLISEGCVSIISKTYDKTTLDKSGNPMVSYECTAFNPINLALGDCVYFDYSTLDINISLRIVSIITNPYNKYECNFSVSNTVPAVEDAAYKIATETVSKDALYNGVRIGPEYGFEAVRNDKKARAFFRSDEMKFQSGDGAGNWTDRLYYDYDSETGQCTLVFNGELSADKIKAITLLATTYFYANKGYIADLTVDGLDTSEKLAKYLSTDTSDDNYIYVHDKEINFITASIVPIYSAGETSTGQWDMTASQQVDTYYKSDTIDSATGVLTLTVPSPSTMDAHSAFNAGYIYRYASDTTYYQLTGSTVDGFVSYSLYTISLTGGEIEQAKSRNGNLLYWEDDQKKYVTENITDYPAMQYSYTELTKLYMSFEYEGTNYVPKLNFGSGTGVGDNGKTKMYKAADGFYIDYFSSIDGTKFTIKITDAGIDFSAFPSVTYTENTVIKGISQLWVQTTTPTAAKANDIWVDTDDYSRYDKTALTGAATLLTSDNEFVTASGTFAITLHAGTAPGIIKKIYNIGTGIITIAGTINGVANMFLYPGESVELITDGTNWRY